MTKEIDELLALENDIEGDWELIHKKFEVKKMEKAREESKKRITEESMFDVPFKEFIHTLTEILFFSNYDEKAIYYCKSLISRIFYQNEDGRKVPKSFRTIWNYFCCPNRYRNYNITCGGCGSNHDVHYKLDKHTYRYFYTEEIGSVLSQVGQTRKTVHCPDCGYRMGIIEGTSEVVSVNKVVNTEEENNDF
jgi:hypothetical protein